MKFMLLLIALVVGSASAWADNTTVWEENWSGTTVNQTPETCTITGYSDITYAYTNGTTSNTRTQSISSFTDPELLIGKNNGSFTVTIPASRLSGLTSTLNLQYSCNRALTVTITNGSLGSNTGSSNTYKYAITVTDNTKNLVIAFQTGSQNARFSNITLTGTSSYTITAQSNNVTYGTVSLNGFVITGSPESGCRYASPAYNVTAGTATVSQNGNNFTVTPSSNCTVRINFEPIPTHTLSSAVNPVAEPAAGTVTLYSTTVAEGATTTATAYANAGYKFSSWSISGTGASLSSPDTDNPITVTMGTANATVTANFEAVTTYEIKYSVNGVIIATNNVEENTDVDLSAPTSGVPNGYVFKGWVVEANKIPTFTNTDPSANYVTSAKSTANITYYAVMAVPGLSDVTWTLDYEEDNASGESVKDDISLGYGNAVNYTAADGSTWTIKAYKQNGMQINTSKNSSIKVPTCTGKILSIAITCTSTAKKAVGFSSSDYTGSGTITYLAEGSESTSQTLDLSKKNVTTGYIVPDGGNAQITKIVVTGKAISYSKYCTTINTFKTAGDWNVASNWSWNSIPNEPAVVISKACNIPNSYTANVDNIIITTGGSLTIADGGQLICSNSVAATVKKSIANANAKDPKNHWYTISSPVHTGSNNYVTIGNETTVNLTNNGAYDMFAYEESTHTWLNQKNNGEANGFDKMYAGQGYIYRNSGNELSYVGNTTVGPVNIALSYTSTLDVADLKGFNLIGNPYTHSIAKGSGKAIDNTKLSTGCYALTNSGTWTIIEDGNEIKPNQGVLVEVSETVADFQIKDINYVAPTPDPGKYKNDNIKFIVESSEYSDAAYAWFDKGIGLTKINHRNENAPMLYIPQDDNNYAIATMTDDTKAFNLNFKAATAGKYTLSYKATGNYNYLHVIDRMTGEDVDMLLEGEYSFIGTPKDSENRFIVRLEYMPNYSEDGNDIFAYQSGSDIYVSGQGELQIFDVTGRSVMTTTINGAESINLSAKGVYILRLVGSEIKTQKIVVR